MYMSNLHIHIYIFLYIHIYLYIYLYILYKNHLLWGLDTAISFADDQVTLCTARVEAARADRTGPMVSGLKPKNI